MTDPTSQDDFILQERLAGRSARSIGKQLSISVSEVNASLDRTLPAIDNSQRMRHVALDLNRMESLLETFFKRAVEKQDTQAALACVKIMERKAALLGLDSPQKLDIVQVQAAQSEPHQFDKIYDAIVRCARGSKASSEDQSGSNGNGSADE